MERVEQLLSSLTDAALALKSLTSQAQEAIRYANERTLEVEKKLVGMADREALVAQREKDVQLTVQKYAGFGDLIAAQEKLAVDLANFENRVIAFRKDESTRLAKIVDGESSNTAMRLALKKDREELEKEKATYKQKLLDELKTKMGA